MDFLHFVLLIPFLPPLLPMIIMSLRCVRNYSEMSTIIVIMSMVVTFILLLNLNFLAEYFFLLIMGGQFINLSFLMFIVCLLPMIIAPLSLAYKYKREDIRFMVLADIVSIVLVGPFVFGLSLIGRF